MKKSNVVVRPVTNQTKEKSMKKSNNDLLLVKANMSYASFGVMLEKTDLYSEFVEGEEEAKKLMGVSTEEVEYWEEQKEIERKAKAFDNLRAHVEAYFTMNSDLLPKGFPVDYTNEEHIEFLGIYMDSLKSEDRDTTGKAYVRNDMVTVIIQGKAKSGNWFTMKDKVTGNKFVFSYPVEDLFTYKNGLPIALRMVTRRLPKFDVVTKTFKHQVTYVSALVDQLMTEGFVVDGTMFRAVLISNSLKYIAGEVDGGKLVKEGNEWVKESYYIWDQGVDIIPGVYALPALTDTSYAAMEEAQSEADIPVGTAGISSFAAHFLSEADEHDLIVAEQDYIAYLEGRIALRMKAKEIKHTNVLSEHGDCTAILDAIMYTHDNDGLAAALSVLAEYEGIALELWSVLFSYKKVTGVKLPFALFSSLKSMVTKARNARDEAKFFEKCTDEVVGIIMRLNNGERFSLTPEQCLAVFEAACAGERLEDKDLFKAIKIKAIAFRDGKVVA